MAKPVILCVDDEAEVLNGVARDLRRHFGAGYRIVKALSGGQGLEILGELERRGSAVALLVVDQRMPDLTGTEFLALARERFPDAKKVLLTAYADSEAAIAGINRVGLDHYLTKPWDPPEAGLYPVLEDLLEDWSAAARPPLDGIRVVGTLWSARCHEVKDFLARNQIPYQWIDVERDAGAGRLMEGMPRARLPLVLLPDGSRLSDPELPRLAERIGLRTRAAAAFYDFIVLGGGPAGLAAAVYGGSEGLRTVLIEREAPGGQAGTSSLIENYLGFPRGLSGADLARRATTQARRFGVEILMSEATAVRAEGPYRIVTLRDGAELSCHALLVACGLEQRRLGIPGAEELRGSGVYYGAALTEAVNYRGEEVVVVGGANSAGQGAMFFSRYARRVHLVVRGTTLEAGMSRYLVDQIRSTENIDVLLETEVASVRGASGLEAVALQAVRGGLREVPARAMIIFVGAVAHTPMLDGLVERDAEGFVLTGPDLLVDRRRPRGWTLERQPFLLETSLHGVFAAGDVRHGSVKRVASAVGEGAVAVALVHEYLKSV